MTPVELVSLLEERGATLALDGDGGLRVTGWRRLSRKEQAAVRSRRDELIRHLAEPEPEPEALPEPEPVGPRAWWQEPEASPAMQRLLFAKMLSRSESASYQRGPESPGQAREILSNEPGPTPSRRRFGDTF